MRTTRRQTLGLLGSVIAAPYVLRSEEAQAAPAPTIIPLNTIGLGTDLGFGVQAQQLCPFQGGGFSPGFVSSGLANDPAGRFAFIRVHAANGAPRTDSIPVVHPSGPVTDGKPAYNISIATRQNGKVIAVVSAERNDKPGQSAGIRPFSRWYTGDVGIELLPVAGFRELTTDTAAQAYVTPVMDAGGQFSIGLDAMMVCRTQPSAPDSGQIIGFELNNRGILTDGPTKLTPAAGAEVPTGLVQVPRLADRAEWWNSYYRDAGGIRTTNLQRMSGTSRVGAPIRLKSSQGNNFSAAGIAANSSGNLCAAFFTDAPAPGAPRADGTFRLVVRIYRPNRTLLAQRVIGTSRIDIFANSFPKVTSLADGRFVIVTDGLAGSTRSINAWLVSPLGVPLAGPVMLYFTASAMATTSLITAPNGHCWVS